MYVSNSVMQNFLLMWAEHYALSLPHSEEPYFSISMIHIVSRPTHLFILSFRARPHLLLFWPCHPNDGCTLWCELTHSCSNWSKVGTWSLLDQKWSFASLVIVIGPGKGISAKCNQSKPFLRVFLTGAKEKVPFSLEMAAQWAMT